MPGEEVRKLRARQRKALQKSEEVDTQEPGPKEPQRDGESRYGTTRNGNGLQLVGEEEMTKLRPKQLTTASPLPNLLDPKPRFDGYNIMGLGSLSKPQDRY